MPLRVPPPRVDVHADPMPGEGGEEVEEERVSTAPSGANAAAGTLRAASPACPIGGELSPRGSHLSWCADDTADAAGDHDGQQSPRSRSDVLIDCPLPFGY
jgi:hypothetical protein